MPTWRVVGTGDSIMGMSYRVPSPGIKPTSPYSDWLIDAEYGRNAYTVGLAKRASHSSILSLALSRSQPRGWVVIQDNGLGCSDESWREFMKRIVRETPTNRILLAVMPGYVASHNAQLAADAARRAVIMGEEIMKFPNRRFVYLNYYMRAHPENFPDGQHPNDAAALWIRQQIKWLVG